MLLLSKKTVLSVFLERDNVKLVISSLGGKVSRLYAGQLTFPAAVLRDAFIVDSAKFASQIRVAINQKPELQKVTEVQLIMPPEKTFIKTLDATDGVEPFLRVLPFFKEELILQEIPPDPKNTATANLVTHIAFERKLVEEFQQPFLDAGKKIVAVSGSAPVLAGQFVNFPDGFLLLGFEKSVGVVVVIENKISQLESWPTEIFATRFVEFVRGQAVPPAPAPVSVAAPLNPVPEASTSEGDSKEPTTTIPVAPAPAPAAVSAAPNPLSQLNQAWTVGNVPAELVDKLKTDLSLNFNPGSDEDIYDLVSKLAVPPGSSSFSLPGLPQFKGLPKITGPSVSGMSELPGKKYLPLVGAMVAGFVLASAVIFALQTEGIGASKPLSPVGKKTVVKEPPPAVVAPEAKPADFKVRVLNGTAVPGEAGKLADSLKTLGFDVTESKNASNSGFLSTRLRTTSDVPQKIIETIKTELLKTYDSVSQEGFTDPDVKVEVIIGKKK